MLLYWVVFVLSFLVLVSGEDKYHDSDDHKNDKNVAENAESGLTNGIISLLNGTFHHLKDDICSVQGKFDVLETIVNRLDTNSCNKTVLSDFKIAVTKDLEAVGKVQSGFENAIRLLQKEQEEIRALINSTNKQEDGHQTKDGDQARDQRLANCTTGWIGTQTKCYYVSMESERTSYEFAVGHCKTLGGKLVEIRNDEEANNLFRLMPDRIGLRDYIYTGEIRRDGIWVYFSNSDPVNEELRTWAPDEPNGSPEICGCVSKEDAFMMTDCYCTGFALHFICEQPRTHL